MQQEGNVSSGKAGKQGGADGLDRVVEADNGSGTPRRSVRRGRMAAYTPFARTSFGEDVLRASGPSRW